MASTAHMQKESDGVKRAQVNADLSVGGSKVNASNPIPVTGTDVNIDSNSLNTNGLIGKASGTNADFISAYASSTSITLSSLPSTISAVNADDIVSVVQIATDGSVTETYHRDDAIITASGTDPTTLTITGAAFTATDSFVVYTNISKQTTTDDGSILVKEIAETTVPTAVADGATVAAWFDEYGKQILAGFNLSVDAQDSNTINFPGLSPSIVTGITQLTAPGDTVEVDVSQAYQYGYAFTIASIDTNVTVQLEGSIDETNYTTVPLDNTAIANVTITNNQMIITANGTYIMWATAPLKDVRFDFVAETGGTAATIDADFIMKKRS